MQFRSGACIASIRSSRYGSGSEGRSPNLLWKTNKQYPNVLGIGLSFHHAAFPGQG